MKKIFLLFATIAVAMDAGAQSGRSVVFNTGDVSMQPNIQHGILSDNITYPLSVSGDLHNPGAKTTSAPLGRWYRYFELADQTVGYITNNELSWSPLWWDSTVQYRYSDGAGGIILEATEWAGYCQILDPQRYTTFNDTTFTSNLNGGGADTINKGYQISIKSTNSYTVDTIRLRAAYIHMPGRPSTVRDTLIIGVTALQKDFYYDTSVDTNNRWLFHNPNIPHDNTKIFSPQPWYADSINRAVLVDNTVTGATETLDTFILNPSDTNFAHLASVTGDTNTLQTYVFPIQKGLGNTIPANQHFAVSVSFKSGDTWTPNGDSIKKFNRFCPVFGFAIGSATGHTTWMPYLYSQGPDYNGASYLDGRGRPGGNTTTYPFINHSGHPARWLSQFTAQDLNGAANNAKGDGYFDQYMWLDAHVTCASCKTVAQTTDVQNIRSIVNKIAAYPNPASQNITVSFILSQLADVNITLTNAIGQVVGVQAINNVTHGNVNFNTEALRSGLYFFTLIANGEHYTGRLSVIH